MLDLPSSTTVAASGPEREMLPYCRTALEDAATEELICASWGRLTLARSSSVMLSAGLSSVFAIASLSRRCFLLRLRVLLRILRIRRCRSCRQLRNRQQLLQDWLARLHGMFHELLAWLKQRAHPVVVEQVARGEAHAQDDNASHDTAGPFYPRRLLPPVLALDPYPPANTPHAVLVALM